MATNLPTVLQYVSAASAFVSASLWLWSALIQLPPTTARLVRNGQLDRSTPRNDAMAKQSRISAGAAFAAGIAALLQGLATLLAA